MNIWSTQNELALAQQHQNAGRLADAEATYRRILKSSPKHADAANLLGTLLAQSGHHTEAISSLQLACQLSPKNHVYLVNMGAAYAAAKEFDLAIRCFRDAAALKPSVPESHYNLGNALRESGKYDEAEAAYRKAITLKPSYPAAWNNLGAVYVERHKLDEANRAIKRALAINPDYPAAHNNLANVLHFQGNPDEAIASCLRAINLKADYLDAFRTMSNIYISNRNFFLAIKCYEKIVTLDPDNSQGLINLAMLQIQCDQHGSAAESLGKLLEIDPDMVRGWFFLGIIQQGRGFFDEARFAFGKALASSPSISLRIRYALSIPPFVNSADEISGIRAKLDSDLDIFSDSVVDVVDNPFDDQLGTNFYLAYHARNDRSIQIKIAQLYEKLAPSLSYIAPHCLQENPKKERIRIGFLSKYIWRHSVAVSFSKVIETLSEDTEFEIFLISSTNHDAADVKKMYANFRGAFVCIPLDLQRSQQFIAALGLDTLVYMDIGMDPLSFLLAFSRLAPIQCVLGGHPVTTGIRTMDYFLSAALCEPAEADSHYSEILVRLASNCFSMTRPELPLELKSRAELGLPESGNIYLCPMMLQKLHPDFDAAMAGILELDQTGHIVLFESSMHARWGELLRQRFDQSITPSLRTRIIFHDWVHNPADFMLIISESTVILDPFHFGIGTTGAFTFAVGTPLVTFPGEFMRGRAGLMFCKLLDTMECVADSVEDYVKKAITIANNGALRQSIKEKILMNNAVIFENHGAAAKDFANFFRSVAAGGRARQG